MCVGGGRFVGMTLVYPFVQHVLCGEFKRPASSHSTRALDTCLVATYPGHPHPLICYASCPPRCRDYAATAPLYLDSLMLWLADEVDGLLSWKASTDARLAFIIGQVRLVMAAAAAAAPSGMVAAGAPSGSDNRPPPTPSEASETVVPVLRLVWESLKAGDEAGLPGHSWWARAQMVAAAADLFCLDASALGRGKMEQVDEALTQVGSCACLKNTGRKAARTHQAAFLPPTLC